MNVGRGTVIATSLASSINRTRVASRSMTAATRSPENVVAFIEAGSVASGVQRDPIIAAAAARRMPAVTRITASDGPSSRRELPRHGEGDRRLQADRQEGAERADDEQVLGRAPRAGVVQRVPEIDAGRPC